MATSKTTNTESTEYASKLHPGAAFKVLAATFRAARDTARLATCSVIVYLFHVNGLRAADDKEYRTLKDATDYIRKELESQIDVGGQMLDRYVTIGSELFSRLKDTKFADLHRKLANMTDKTANDGPAMVLKYLETDHHMKTFADYMRRIGYSTGHDTPAPTSTNDPEKRVANLADNIKALSKALQDKAHKRPETAARLIAQQVAAVVSPVELAKQAIQRITDATDLLDLIQWANGIADKLADAEDSKPAPKVRKPVKAKAKATRSAATA